MIGNKTKYTPSEAIGSIAGMHRKKFYQMIREGQISYETAQRGTKAGKLFDASELARVFGSDFRPNETAETVKAASQKHIETGDTALLNQQIQHLTERLQDRDSQLQAKDSLLDEIRRDRDDWKEQAQRLLLTHTEKASNLPVEQSSASEAPPGRFSSNQLSSGQIWPILATILLIGAFSALLISGLRQHL